jgi:hypothetical protein
VLSYSSSVQQLPFISGAKARTVNEFSVCSISPGAWELAMNLIALDNKCTLKMQSHGDGSAASIPPVYNIQFLS